HEGSVDLERVYGEVVEIRQAGPASAEVVDGDLRAEGVDSSQNVGCSVEILYERSFGHLEPQPLDRQACRSGHLGESLGQPLVSELTSGQVHGQIDVVSISPPLGDAPACLFQDDRSEFGDGSRHLSDVDEGRGGEHTAFGMLPSDERFNADWHAVVEPHHWLEMHDELVSFETAANLELQS